MESDNSPNGGDLCRRPLRQLLSAGKVLGHLKDAAVASYPEFVWK